MLVMGREGDQVSDMGEVILCMHLSLYVQGSAGHQDRHNFPPVKEPRVRK